MNKLKIFVCFVLVTFLIACESTQYGNLTVDYRIGSGTSTCEDAKITTLRIQLNNSEGSPVWDDIVTCNPQKQSVTISDIPSGGYTVKIDGLDKDSLVSYSGENENISVSGNQNNGPYTVVLTQVPPSIQLTFGFEQSTGLSGCGYHKVNEIRVVLYYEGTSKVFDDSLNCTDLLDNGLLISGTTIVEGSYDLRIRGIDENDSYSYYYDQDALDVKAGKQIVVNASLNKCQGTCSEP